MRCRPTSRAQTSSNGDNSNASIVSLSAFVFSEISTVDLLHCTSVEFKELVGTYAHIPGA